MPRSGLNAIKGLVVMLVISSCALAAGIAASSVDSGSVERAGARSSSESDESQESALSKPAAKPAYPNFQNVRFEEDWSALSASARTSAYERFKFIPFNQEEDVYLSLGGQLRLRGEGWSDFGFGGPGIRDDRFGLLRLRLHADLWLTPRVRVFVEGKSALATGRELPGGLRGLDVDSADLQNAFVDLKASLKPVGLLFRVGRQEMQLGKQRLVSPLDWANTRRTFDGVRAIVKTKNWRVDGFWSKLVPVQKYSFNSSGDSDTDLYGIYASGKPAGSAVDVDLYWLGLEEDRSSFGGVGGEEDRHTVGARAGGSPWSIPLDFDAEFAYQFGDHARRDIRAYMFAGQLGYRFQDASGSPRLYFGFDYASGDGDPRDGRVETFNQLFPLGHAYLGFVDLVGRQNIIDLNEGLSLKPHPRLQLAASGHSFWRANLSDDLYNAGGGTVRSGDLAESRFVGLEIDLTTSYAINRHFTLSGGYSHLFPGKFIEDSGASEGIDFVYMVFQTTF